MKKSQWFCAALAALVLGIATSLTASAGEKIRVIMIDGQNNHNWRATSPFLKMIFDNNDKFTIDVTSNLRKGDKPGSLKTVPFPPDLSKYDVVVSNYNARQRNWGSAFEKQFEKALKAGKIGYVVVHAANNAFNGWDEYDQMIGMGWRNKNYGKRLKLDDDGKKIIAKKGEDNNSGHRYRGPFQIVVRNDKHPVTKGMPAEWMHANDELYDNMRGPIQNVTLLATAYSKGTKAHEPMIWTISYGKGRVFHTPMGHDVRAMNCVGFATTLLRGTEWAATGNVTVPIPDNFPSATKVTPVSGK